MTDFSAQVAIPVERTMYRRLVSNFLKKLNLHDPPGAIEDSFVHRFVGDINLHQWEIAALKKLVSSDENEFIDHLHQADMILVSS